MSAGLAIRNRLIGNGSWTDVGDNAASNPPIQNLGTPQAPSPRAKFTGTTLSFSFNALDQADAAEQFRVQVLSLLGHTFPDNALIKWKRGDGTLLAAQTWRHFTNRPMNSHIVLPEPVTLDTIQCEVSNLPDQDHFIASTFAGQLWQFEIEENWDQNNNDETQVKRIGSTAWTFADARLRGHRVKVLTIDHAEAFGVPMPGLILPIPAWSTNGSSSSVDDEYNFASATGTLLSSTSAVTKDKWNRVTAYVDHDAGNDAIVSVNIGGDGDQALQPGRNTVVGEAVGESLSFVADSAFSGTIVIEMIEELSTGITGDDAQSILDDVGKSEPVIYFPRLESQQYISSLGIYGLIDKSGSIPHAGGPFHNVEFSVLEQG